MSAAPRQWLCNLADTPLAWVGQNIHTLSPGSKACSRQWVSSEMDWAWRVYSWTLASSGEDPLVASHPAHIPHRAPWCGQGGRQQVSRWPGARLGRKHWTVPGEVTRLVTSMTAGGSPRWPLLGLGNGGWHPANGLPIPVIFILPPSRGLLFCRVGGQRAHIGWWLG